MTVVEGVTVEVMEEEENMIAEEEVNGAQQLIILLKNAFLGVDSILVQ